VHGVVWLGLFAAEGVLQSHSSPAANVAAQPHVRVSGLPHLQLPALSNPRMMLQRLPILEFRALAHLQLWCLVLVLRVPVEALDKLTRKQPRMTTAWGCGAQVLELLLAERLPAVVSCLQSQDPNLRVSLQTRTHLLF
jgi:hypothetical protein